MSLTRPQRNTVTVPAIRLTGSRATWLAVLLVLLAAGLRLYRLGNQSIWWDEGFSVFMARLPLAEMAAATAHDTHPPLYYALLHLWRLAAGDSAVAVRLLSALAGVVTAALAYRVVHTLAGPRAALAATGLVGLNRLLIWYAQEVRQYALAACLALAALALAQALWQRRAGWHIWLGYVLVNAAGLLTLYLYVSVLLVQNLAFVVALWRAPQKWQLALRWYSAQAAIALAGLPWLLYYLPRAPHTFRPPDTLALAEVLRLYLASVFAGEASDIDRFWLVSGLGLVVLGLGLLAALRYRRRVAGSAFATLALFGGALTLPALVWLLNLPSGLGLTFVPNPRYFVLLAPWALGGLGIAAAVVGNRWRWVAHTGLAVLAALWLGLLAQYYAGRYLRDDFISAAATISAYRQAEDGVVLHNDQNWPVAAYHLGGRDWLGLNSGRPIATADDAAALVGPAWEAHAGVWLLVTPEALMNDPTRQVYQWLATRARAVRAFAGGPDNQLFFFARTPERAATIDTLAAPEPPRPPALTIQPGLALERAEWALPEYRQGDMLRVFVYWRNSGSAGDHDYELRLTTLMGVPAEAVAQTLTLEAGAPALVRQQVNFPVRAYVGPGPYWLVAQAGDQQTRLGLVQVVAAPAPPVITAPPATTQPVQFEQGLQLVGYTATTSGGRLTVSPYWTTSVPVDTPYKFFAHVLGDAPNPATGTLLWAQEDREPNFGATPVSAWRVGTVIRDTVSFALPPGHYTLRLGWYEALSGERLLVLDAAGQPIASETVLGPFEVPP